MKTKYLLKVPIYLCVLLFCLTIAVTLLTREVGDAHVNTNLQGRSQQLQTAQKDVLIAFGNAHVCYFKKALASLRLIPKPDALKLLEYYTKTTDSYEYDSGVRWDAYYMMAGVDLKPPKDFLTKALRSEKTEFVATRIHLALWKLYNVPLPKGIEKSVKMGYVSYFEEP